MKATVIINEQHKIMAEQQRILEEKYSEIEYLNVPANGWTLEEMKMICNNIEHIENSSNVLHIIFISPIPYMLCRLSMLSGYHDIENAYWYPPFNSVKVFHNDNRIKKELPNGKIIMTVAEEGWVLV